jgi:hypothetical protein
VTDPDQEAEDLRLFTIRVFGDGPKTGDLGEEDGRAKQPRAKDCGVLEYPLWCLLKTLVIRDAQY